MKLNQLLILLLVVILFSCKKEEKDNTFSIYHLKPNSIYTTADSLVINGSFSIRRNDFFVVKNYDAKNENHKIKIDSFVVNYLKSNNFLSVSKNSNWRLTFFKYGKGIDVNTEHIDGTDYAIHDLFSYKKEIGSYYFDTRIGYGSTNYNNDSTRGHSEKREVISNYFQNLNTALNQNNNIIDKPNDIAGEYEMIKGFTHFIGSEDDEILSANLIIEKLSETDYGYYSAHKIKNIRPNERVGVLRNYKNNFYNLSICDNNPSEGITEENFINGIYLHNQVIIKKKGDTLAMIRYGGNFRRYMLYKKLRPETNYNIYLEDALDRSKFDYNNFIIEYNKAKNYDKSKLQIAYIETNYGWVSKHNHKEDSINFNKTHYYQNPNQDDMFTKQDSTFLHLFKSVNY